MKSKKRHQSSSDESDESELSLKSNSSSGSDSDDSSESEHRHKKKRKRADSSDSDSDSDDQKRSKKRKHKKRKKKHSKKKRHSDSADESQSVEEISSVSEGEISPKKKRKHKHKHKHSKRARSSSASVIIEDDAPVERRLHSVVKERRGSSGDDHVQPDRTYYQRDYHHSGPVENERDREVQRFYRGSSKERRYQEQYRYGQERNERYQPDRYKNTGKYHEEDYRQRPYDEYRRNQRYEENKFPGEDYHKRPREDNYQVREEHRGPNRYNQYEDRRPKRQEYDNGRDYRERRGPPAAERYREREYPDKRERFRDDGFASDRPRDARRDRPPRPEHQPPAPQDRVESRSRSAEGRYKAERRRDGSRPAPRRPDDKPRERASRFNKPDDKEYSWGKAEASKEGEAPEDKEKPNFGLSGKLTADANTVNGVVIKYAEPDDAKQPKRRWRFYPFKGDKALPILYIHRQSCFLLGRDKKVADIPLDHPSVSKQHAALQYRATPFDRPDGSRGRRVRPYVIDLDSANGTFVNNKKIEPRRYVELLERDVVKFGFSQREYVLLHENSKDDAQDDDDTAAPTAERVKDEKRIKQETAADGE